MQIYFIYANASNLCLSSLCLQGLRTGNRQVSGNYVFDVGC